MIALEDFLEEVDKLIERFGDKCYELKDDKFAIVGDIHADFNALNFILSKVKYRIIFLGDYGDRGSKPVETYYALLKRANEDESVLLRGNHESSLVSPHDLPLKLESYFGSDEAYKRLKKLWERLPISAITKNLWLVHGGVPTKNGRIDIEGIKFEEILNPSEDIMLEMMWNDPWEGEDCVPNPRGIGMLFGKRATKELLKTLNVKVVVRSHEPMKVLKVEQNGMVVTIGSCMEPYGLSKAAFLIVEENSMGNGYDLMKFGVIFSKEDV